ncbi:MAG: acyl transferase [Flavobacteriaceae bacterium]|nr:acyl transferase [Flavobacteriaceae bacterium]
MKLNNYFYNIESEKNFEIACFKLLSRHYNSNSVYRSYCDLINKPPSSINSIREIPFLPISFFKTHKVKRFSEKSKIIFKSSRTTNKTPSQHFLKNTIDYKKSFSKSFELFYGKPSDWVILALLPGSQERKNSSLIYMVSDLIKQSNSNVSGFYLDEFEKLYNVLLDLDSKNQKTILIGVSYALLSFIEMNKIKLKHTTIIETGGMKGKRKELIRNELHEKLCNGFGVKSIHSEYGMTELLSQAYSIKNGLFECPPWMKVLSREIDDPLTICEFGQMGGLNIIDLANSDSCPFIATEDLGKVYSDGRFEVLGRFDQAEIRGCNLMVFN